MAKFSSIPAVPNQNISEWQAAVLNALKENVELLTGYRGAGAASNAAVIKGNIRVNPAGTPSFSRVTATGQGYTISGQNVAALDDFGKLINDVQLLANDVATLRAVVNTLIAQLKG